MERTYLQLLIPILPNLPRPQLLLRLDLDAIDSKPGLADDLGRIETEVVRRAVSRPVLQYGTRHVAIEFHRKTVVHDVADGRPLDGSALLEIQLLECLGQHLHLGCHDVRRLPEDRLGFEVDLLANAQNARKAVGLRTCGRRVGDGLFAGFVCGMASEGSSAVCEGEAVNFEAEFGGKVEEAEG